jgi:hypothetical protein
MTEKEYLERWIAELWVAYILKIKRENWPQ